jgi:hypothetical protein
LPNPREATVSALIPQARMFVNPFGMGSQLGMPISSGVLSVRIPRKLGCRSRPSPLISR